MGMGEFQVWFCNIQEKRKRKDKATKERRNKGKRKEKKKKNNYPSEKLRMLQSFETWLSGQEFWGSPKRTKRKNEKKKKRHIKTRNGICFN